ncbi:hypothetical protein CK203_098225 [Vitis vinifera]|uniref:Uncharacterized protein n=1 Tax=Vitis vinifera TaxID=29760 RepID=A0A438FI84_VITVI|nr:hypothetical protein CK203_098225 [Vitis vinifera]
MLKAEANPRLPYVIKASSSTTGIAVVTHVMLAACVCIFRSLTALSAVPHN